MTSNKQLRNIHRLRTYNLAEILFDIGIGCDNLKDFPMLIQNYCFHLNKLPDIEIKLALYPRPTTKKNACNCFKPEFVFEVKQMVGKLRLLLFLVFDINSLLYNSVFNLYSP